MRKNVSLPVLFAQLAVIVALVVFLSTTFWNSMDAAASPEIPAWQTEAE